MSSLDIPLHTVVRKPLALKTNQTQEMERQRVKGVVMGDRTKDGHMILKHSDGVENDGNMILKHHHSVKKVQTDSVVRRNLRERTRVRGVNDGFGKLKQYVPNMRNKSSEVETLRGAIEYIKQLKELLGEEMNDSNSMKADYDDCTGMIKILILEFIIMFNIFRRVLFL